jgi:hypothetical protein
MKKLALTATVAAAFALTACGSSDDASEDAMADTVEMPADEAMAGLPDPAADATAAADAIEAAEEDAIQTAEEAADEAEAAVADIEAAAADAQAATE